MNRSLEKLRTSFGPEVKLSLVKRATAQQEVCPSLSVEITRIVDSCRISPEKVKKDKVENHLCHISEPLILHG